MLVVQDDDLLPVAERVAEFQITVRTVVGRVADDEAALSDDLKNSLRNVR
jgi:hypothetical protein